ncbi:lmo1851 family serine protease [Solibacillus sp. FSL H8-0538]|uniref:lmo1851 family serine protease n=1 Tax=Solibacillus sp. FSL H8-0538 TaxID=2921400 RepID=UPI0030FCF9D0
MDDQKHDGEQTEHNEQQEQPVKPAGKFLRIKPFAFIMLMFLTILVTAGLTIFALTFGDKKVVEVKVPVERAEFTKLYEAFDELKKNYYMDIDDEEVIYGAINGMFDALGDPYSDYMNKDEADSFNASLSSSFQGIGAEIQERNGYIMVVSPIKNSPAEKAGLLPKDIILEVDGESIKGMSASEAVLLIRGEKGTKVTLTIQRGDAKEPMQVVIVRDDIPVETVYGEMGDDKIAHIQITSFSEDTYEELAGVLEDYDAQGMKGIILDVRQNPGGFLNAALEIANLFVEEGKAIVQVQDRTSEPEVMYAEGGKKYKQPVTVLIDEGSASASEILAAALSESAGVKIIGLTSFGKGTVQTVSYLPDGSNLKFTTGKWLTPNGNWINEKGIKPDVKVDYPDYATLAYVDPATELTIGSDDAVISSAERMLEVLGYKPGDVDTKFTESTAEAVKNFQEDNELEPTGILSGETTYALMDALRVKIAEEDPQVLKAIELLLGTEVKASEN